MSRTVEQVIEGVIAELERSVTIHGNWSDYNRHDMYRAIRDEFEELHTAWYGGDDTGEHGMINEARQLAVCCIKLLICSTGVLPYAPTPLQKDPPCPILPSA